MAKQKGVSMKFSTFSEGGGLLSDVNVEWKKLRFEMFDYNGTINPPVPSLALTMEVEGEEEVVEHYSCGPDWEISEDGLELIPTGKSSTISKNSKLGILLGSVVDAGGPEVESITELEGLKAFMVRRPIKTGFAQTPRADGRTFEKSILVVDSIIELPGEREQEKNVVEEKAADAVVEILKKNPKGLDKKKLATAVFAALRDDKDRNAVVQLLYNDEFLKSGGPWTFEKGVLKV